MGRRQWFLRGMRDGIPISLGYFAVAFTLGIAAREAGMTAFQAGLTSLMINASAGEFAGFTLMAAGASYIEVAVMELVANARYFLMSCALSQKLGEKVPLKHRLLIGFDVTDEIFGVSMSVPGKLDPFYTYGVMLVAMPGWALGTYFGVLMGSILPTRIVSALSVGLYGMFLAVIMPQARQDSMVARTVIASFVISFIINRLPLLAGVSSGIKVIGLTVVIALAAALLRPIREEVDDAA